jgi:uncharacterized protein
MEKGKIDQVIESIVQGYKPERIILFGSHAHDKANENSDLDLLIIKDTDERYFQRMKTIRSLFKVYPCAMDIFVYTNEEFEHAFKYKSLLPFIAFNEGIVVYERGNSALD